MQNQEEHYFFPIISIDENSNTNFIAILEHSSGAIALGFPLLQYYDDV